jgi:uncharacterized membrane protein YgcG
MSQVLGVLGRMDFSMLLPVLAWHMFWNLRTSYFFNFPIFLGRSKLWITETADTESADTGGTPVMIWIFCSCRDAEDAVHARDGYDYDGYRLRVEFPRGGGPGGFRGSNRGGGGGGGDRGGRGRGPPARRSQYRVLVTGNVTTAHEAWWVVTYTR